MCLYVCMYKWCQYNFFAWFDFIFPIAWLRGAIDVGVVVNCYSGIVNAAAAAAVGFDLVGGEHMHALDLVDVAQVVVIVIVRQQVGQVAGPARNRF